VNSPKTEFCTPSPGTRLPLEEEGAPPSGTRDSGSGIRAPHLGVSVLWTVAGYVVYMACQWAMLVVVARLGSPEKVGEFALSLAVSAPVILFANLGLRRIQVTDAEGRFRFCDYFGLRLVMAALALVAIAVIAGASGYGPSVVAAILAMGVAKAVESASDVTLGVLQQGERMDLVARSMALRGVAGVAGLAGGLALTGSVASALLVLAAGWAGVLLFHDLPAAARRLEADGIRPRWSAPVLGSLFRLALPLGVVTTLASLMATVPSVLIEKFLGAAELGLYTAMAYAWAASHRIASAMGEAASARLARHVAAGRKAAFVRVLASLLALAGAGGLLGLAVALLAGRPLLTVLYGPAYGAREELFTGFMAVSIVSNMAIVLDYGMTALRRLKIQPLLYGGALLLFATLCIALIPARGLGGAVLALGIVSAAQGLCSLAVVARAVLRFPAVACPPSLGNGVELGRAGGRA
jgi:O-antigen/teichoic acid export membrane protein